MAMMVHKNKDSAYANYAAYAKYHFPLLGVTDTQLNVTHRNT